MFLHIGNGETVKKSDIIGIFDMDTATLSPVTKKTLHHYEKEKKMFYGDTDIPRSFLLLSQKERKEESEIRLSLISSQGLLQRCMHLLPLHDNEN